MELLVSENEIIFVLEKSSNSFIIMVCWLFFNRCMKGHTQEIDRISVNILAVAKLLQQVILVECLLLSVSYVRSKVNNVVFKLLCQSTSCH